MSENPGESDQAQAGGAAEYRDQGGVPGAYDIEKRGNFLWINHARDGQS